ncbi:MAG: HDOD domain-containing protein [bacterium]|nr:HDOD domain-containing protein [bacterium]
MATLTPVLQEEAIAELISERVSNVPLLPHVVTRLLGIMGRNDHSLTDVVKIVENDLGLASRILRVANSAAFSPRQGISSLQQGILHLGEKMVAGIAIGSCTANIFNRELIGYESSSGELWDHCLRTAIAAREITASCSRRVSTDLAFTGGLLHDVGKAIIDEFLNKRTQILTAMCDKGEGGDFLDAERDSIGIDHADVGFALARHWNLPPQLAAVIKFHHRPVEADPAQQELVYLVHLGDILAMLGGTGTGADTLSYKIDEGYQRYFQLGKDGLPILLLKIEEEFTRAKSAVFAE